MARPRPLFSSSATTNLYATPPKRVTRNMFAAPLNPMHMMHHYARDPPPRPPSRIGHRSPRAPLCPLPAYTRNSCHAPPLSNRTRSRRHSDATWYGAVPLNADEDVVLYRTSGMVTDGDAYHKPSQEGYGQEAHKVILPIGSGRTQSPCASPTSQVSTDSRTGWFPPPGLPPPNPAMKTLELERMMRRPASTPPSLSYFPPPSYAQPMYSAPPIQTEFVYTSDFHNHGQFAQSDVDPEHLDPALEERFVHWTRLQPKEIRGPFAKTPDDVLNERPALGYNVCLDLECISSRCQHCAYMRHRGSLLVTKLGRRIVDPRLWYIQPNEPAADWPYVEDKLKLLPLQASYVQGYQQACQDRESQRAQAAA